MNTGPRDAKENIGPHLPHLRLHVRCVYVCSLLNCSYFVSRIVNCFCNCCFACALCLHLHGSNATAAHLLPRLICPTENLVRVEIVPDGDEAVYRYCQHTARSNHTRACVDVHTHATPTAYRSAGRAAKGKINERMHTYTHAHMLNQY